VTQAERLPLPALGDVRWIPLPQFRDSRGLLTVAEGMRDVPFPIARIFLLSDVPAGQERGAHAHYDTEQVAVAVRGSLQLEVSDGLRTSSFRLDDSARGLFLASTPYTPDRYLRTWAEFCAARGVSAGRQTTREGTGR
jgi:WxcM-like protein